MSEPKQENKKPRGLVLKEAREAQGLSIETAHEATKIPLDVLRSIEEGYTVRTISAFYLKGFLKMYAQYLGVDVHEIVDDYHEEELPEPIKEKKVPLKDSIDNIEAFWDRQRQRQVIITAGIILLLFGITKFIGCIRHMAVNSPQKKAAVSVKPKPRVNRAAEKKKQARERQAAAKTSPATEAKAAAPKVVPPSRAQAEPAKPAVEQPVDKKVTVTVKPRKKAWLQVRVDGNVVFQSTLKEGISETWQAKEVIEFSGKHIYYLDFEINGKVLGTLGRGDRNARRVIITKNGLTVKK